MPEVKKRIEPGNGLHTRKVEGEKRKQDHSRAARKADELKHIAEELEEGVSGPESDAVRKPPENDEPAPPTLPSRVDDAWRFR